MANEYTKKCPTLLIMEIQIKITMWYHYTTSECVKLETDNNKLVCKVEWLKLSYIAGASVKWYNHFGKYLAVLLKLSIYLT